MDREYKSVIPDWCAEVAHNLMQSYGFDPAVLEGAIAAALHTERERATAEQAPVAWIDPASLERMKERNGWTTVLVRPRREEDCTMPLYATALSQEPSP